MCGGDGSDGQHRGTGRVERGEQPLGLAVKPREALGVAVRAEPPQRAKDVRSVVGVDVEHAERVVVERHRRREAPQAAVLLGEDSDEDDRSVDLVEQPGHRLRYEGRSEDVPFFVRDARRAVAAHASQAVRARP